MAPLNFKAKTMIQCHIWTIISKTSKRSISHVGKYKINSVRTSCEWIFENKFRSCVHCNKSFCSVTWCKWIYWFLMQNLWKLKNSCFYWQWFELKSMISWPRSISTNNAPAWIAHCISKNLPRPTYQKYETFDLWLAFCLLATWIQYSKHIVHSSK